MRALVQQTPTHPHSQLNRASNNGLCIYPACWVAGKWCSGRQGGVEWGVGRRRFSRWRRQSRLADQVRRIKYCIRPSGNDNSDHVTTYHCRHVALFIGQVRAQVGVKSLAYTMASSNTWYLEFSPGTLGKCYRFGVSRVVPGTVIVAFSGHPPPPGRSSSRKRRHRARGHLPSAAAAGNAGRSGGGGGGASSRQQGVAGEAAANSRRRRGGVPE